MRWLKDLGVVLLFSVVGNGLAILALVAVLVPLGFVLRWHPAAVILAAPFHLAAFRVPLLIPAVLAWALWESNREKPEGSS